METLPTGASPAKTLKHSAVTRAVIPNAEGENVWCSYCGGWCYHDLLCRGKRKAKEVYIWGLEGGAAVLLLFELYCSFSLTYIHSRHKSFLYCKTIFVQWIKMNHLQTPCPGANDPSSSDLWLGPAPVVSLRKKTSVTIGWKWAVIKAQLFWDMPMYLNGAALFYRSAP